MDHLVSIIIPVYNAQDTLMKALQSVVSQSYTNLEIIVVNDGSTDQSAAIIDEMSRLDYRIRVFHKKNGGQSSARNLGLREAHGEYIQFLDSDDWLQYNAIECALSHLIANERTDFILYGFNIYNGSCLLRTPNAGNYIYSMNDGYNGFVPIKNLIVSPCNKLFKRQYITHFFEENRIYGEDAIFNYQNLTNDTNIQCISDCLYNVQTSTPESVNKRFRAGKICDLLDSLYIEEKKLEDIFSQEIDIKKNREISLTTTAKFIENAFFFLKKEQAITECINVKQNLYFNIIKKYNEYAPIYHRITLNLLERKKYNLLSIYSYYLLILERFIKHKGKKK